MCWVKIPEGGLADRVFFSPDSCSVIRYRLRAGEISAMHWLESDELWLHQSGGNFYYTEHFPDGKTNQGVISPGGYHLFAKGTAFSLRVLEDAQAACVVSPAFDPQKLHLVDSDYPGSEKEFQMEINVMTFNIQHGVDYSKVLSGENNDFINLPLMAYVIRQQGAQIVGLNEIRNYIHDPLSADQAGQLGALLGYHSYFAKAISFGDGCNYGNGLLSAFPILEAHVVPIPDPEVKDEDVYYETRCLLEAQLDVPGGLTVLVCHFGLAKSEEKLATDTIMAELAKLQGPVVLMGDFNITPDNENIARLLTVMEDSATHMSSPKKSFPSNDPEIKIDYIMTRGLTVTAADVPAVLASDHRPHTAKIIVK